MPVSQQDVSTTTQSTNAPVNVRTELDNMVNSTRSGVKQPTTNTTSGQVDYTQRLNEVKSPKKVSLVGRYGAGTSNTFGGATQAAKSGKTDFTKVTFDVTPQLSESGSVSAVDIGEIRSAGSIVIYLGSPARTFSITATFVSRTSEEADKTLQDINVLKAWRMPMSDQDEPETIRLFAYDTTLKGIPCLMVSVNVEYPDDVDYIQSSNQTPVPIIQKVNISLKEVRNFEDIQKFDYVKFKSGTLDQW